MGNQATKDYPKYHRHASKKNVHWEEAERPHPPGQPLLVPASPGGQNDVVTIRWEPPISDGGTPITGYMVEHRRTGSPHWVRATPGPVARCQITLSGLEPGWRYQFRVSAENAAGTSDPSAVSEPLTVTLAKGVATAPHFNKELQDTVALENEKVELTVRVTGTPAPKISWFKDGLEVFSGRRSRVVTDGEGTMITSTLIIHQAALADEGEVKCAATNRAGHAVTKAKLRLEAPPSIRLPRQYEDGLLFELGEVIRVKVSVAGRPAPRVSWLHNGEVLRPGPRHEILLSDKGATLRVSEARRSDRGEYQVRAVNQLGEDVAAFLVTVTDRPTPPGKAMMAMTLGRSVTLTWAPPDDDGGCKIGNYIVEYYRVGWDMWLKAATCRQMTTTLGDLIEGSEYKFRVKAENPYGVSDPGDESETVFIPDPKRGINDPQQRGADGSESTDWWSDRKRRRDPGSGTDHEDAEENVEEKKSRAVEEEVSTPTWKRPSPISVEVEDVSPIPSPVPRESRPSVRTLDAFVSRTRSAAPGTLPRMSHGDGAPEPPKRRNRSLPRSGREDSASPDPESMGCYLPTTPDEMGVVKGRLFGIHLSTDNVRSKRENVGAAPAAGIEEVIYATVPSATLDRSPGGSPTRSPRRSPIGGGEVTREAVSKPEANGVLDLRQVEEYANKYEAKLMELERRQRELEERGRQRQREIEEEREREMEKMLKEKDREKEREREKERQRAREIEREKERQRDILALRKEAYIPQKKATDKPTTVVPASGQDRLFPRSEDGSMAGDSSEFLLVLLPNSRANTEEREAARSDAVAALQDDGEQVAPPMSLSAPELGALDPDVPFMRNAVSSTELLHERAMARFYQEVAEEEAEKARRRRMSIERRVSLERRLSIERKNRERLKSRMDSVEESEAEDLPVNFKRFAGARPSDGSLQLGAAPSPAPSPAPPQPASAPVDDKKRERVLTSEEREEAEFAALRERLNKAAQDAKREPVVTMRNAWGDEDLDDYLDEEELGEEEEEEEEEVDELGEEEESEEEVPPEQPDEEADEETYHPRFATRSVVNDTPPTPPPHRKAEDAVDADAGPEPPLFIPKAETYTTMTEHDNVASVLLTKRHSPVKGDVKPKPILKRRGSVRKSKSPGSKSPGSKSPGSKSPQRKSPLSPLAKIKNKIKGERRKSTDSVESDKSEGRNSKLFKPIQSPESPVKMRSKPERPSSEDVPAPTTRGPPVQVVATPYANLGISAAEAARNKRGLARREPVKDEAAAVVINHYSELVREYGSTHKQQQIKYLSFDELKARADDGPAEPQPQRAVLSPPSPSPPASPQPPAPAAAPAPSWPTDGSHGDLGGRESRRNRDKREPSVSRRDTSVARRDTSRRDTSVSKRDASVSRRDTSSSRRDTSLTRRDPLGSAFKRESGVASTSSRREPSVSRRDPSSSRVRESSTSRTSASRRDASLSRRGRDSSLVRRSKEALARRDVSAHRSHTSVASSLSDDFRPRTPEEEEALVRQVEENVKSTIGYVMDFGLVVLAVWLYLFRSELLAVPVLALLVYRQVKEEVRRRTPAWVLRMLDRARAIGQPAAPAVSPSNVRQ